MPIEQELVEPVCAWLRKEHSSESLMLIYEEVQGRGGRRPDLLVLFAPMDNQSIDDVSMIAVEIEISSRGAIHDPRNGTRQLRKYPANLKYLAIPRTVAVHEAAREIPSRCARSGLGLLVVDLVSGRVQCDVMPVHKEAERTLRTYPVAMRRWIALRKSSHVFRHVSAGRIVESA